MTTIQQQQQQQILQQQQQQLIRDKYKNKIEELNIHLKQLNVTKNEYQKLIEKLKVMPDTLSQKVHVPLGRYAFFEGTVTNTNEIMILLGDNYFAERSCKQTIDIIQRRDNDIDFSIKNINQQIQSLQQRFEITTNLSKYLQTKEEEDIIEIKEEYDSDEERKKEKIKKSLEEQRIKDNEKIVPKQKKNTMGDKELDEMFSRLLELEAEEEQLGSDYEEDDDQEDPRNKIGAEEEYSDLDEDDDESNYTKIKKGQRKSASEEYGDDQDYDNADDDGYEEVYEYYDEDGNRVEMTAGEHNDADIQYIEEYDDVEPADNEDNGDDDAEYDDNNEEEFNVKDSLEIKNYLEQRRKNFNITSTPTTTTSTTSTSSSYKQSQSPKSILKTPSQMDLHDENNPIDFIKKVNKQVSFNNANNVKEISTPNPPKNQAFSGDIIEKNTDSFEEEEDIKPVEPVVNQPEQKVSRFKSSRQNR
ncbi:RNA polymerase II subunit 5-mediating protein [Heterostelium album PN500]|uniref:RNA polymerase II subunit 5-mediating protein n=1 Tax=Heterostelium pallidum (strain ATCC 26659 / Pp 5 / PN500) TaxID=670386 RepID=D3BLE4_HETP5|nr:RNA polymerase II subunit 5-mediating protein [Heterostelium album PN500]EFA77878.1 RNA polymerase II subunit 5-mediating protein [Heterostelium album PN500]|eukprot:XP_020430006.1 RNA polymerase II subunit 5-mediating protein [Heterostelium album PN500]